jgi:pimeloyl-ACP methyl ester carboxylesterase
MRIGRVLLAALCALPALPCSAAQPASVAYAASCAVEGAPGGSRCGTLRVREDRARAGGRILSLRFVIVPGQGSAPADPIVYVAGGPGESAVEALPLVLPTLRSVDTRREIIFLDQRGTGAAPGSTWWKYLAGPGRSCGNAQRC